LPSTINLCASRFVIVLTLAKFKSDMATPDCDACFIYCTVLAVFTSTTGFIEGVNNLSAYPVMSGAGSCYNQNVDQ